MKNLKLFRAWTLAFVIPVYVQSAEAVVNIQNVGAGARSASLGNSYVAIADDADAVFANPAGLGQMSNSQMAYTNVSLLYTGIEGDDLGQHLVSFAKPMGNFGLGLGYERIGSELMSENGAFLSVSYKIGSSFNFGVNAKYLFWSVGNIPADNGVADPLSNTTAGNLGVDFGLLWKTPVKGARFGLMVKNVNKPDVSKGTAAQVDPDAGSLPMDVHAGVAYQVNPSSLLSVQYVLRDAGGDGSDSRLVVGGETKLVEGLMLRAGGSKLFEEDMSGDINAGLGYIFGKLHFDYGYRIPLDLTQTNGAHRFSFAYGF